MPNDIDHNASAQRRTSKLLAAMGIFVALGIIAYIILTLLVNRSVPATADSADGEDYEAVLLQRGTADSYADFIDASEKDLKQAYGVIKPRKVNLTVDGAEVEAVRCDIQAYYAVLATITYPSGDVVYVSGLTKLASINDIVNLVESVTLS